MSFTQPFFNLLPPPLHHGDRLNLSRDFALLQEAILAPSSPRSAGKFGDRSSLSS
ncbi:hypothetical protein IQ219_05590, partial [Synechocystis sp. LEGE 06083]|nr:hypothetical protein [Synechocystis sp. LEGE 06083]